MQQQAPPERSTSETQVKDGNQYDHRFQRTDQWMPVYSWLESLQTDEVVKSKDIQDWLSANPQVLQQLSSRHSRYHLLHYIKKCHVKLLKRKEKLKGPQVTEKATSVKVDKNVEAKLPVPVQYVGNNLNNIPKDSDLYKAKQIEARQKYEILVEFEKQLFAQSPGK